MPVDRAHGCARIVSGGPIPGELGRAVSLWEKSRGPLRPRQAMSRCSVARAAGRGGLR